MGIKQTWIATCCHSYNQISVTKAQKAVICVPPHLSTFARWPFAASGCFLVSVAEQLLIRILRGTLLAHVMGSKKGPVTGSRAASMVYFLLSTTTITFF